MDTFIQIDITDIESSNIKNVLYVYDGENIQPNGNRNYLGTLVITFNNDKMYRYLNVKLTDVVPFISSQSFGNGFNSFIKNTYAGEAVN